jgi:hypothetical protein
MQHRQLTEQLLKILTAFSSLRSFQWMLEVNFIEISMKIHWGYVGVSGALASCRTSTEIEPATPRVEKMSIIGQLEESLPLSLISRYFGGVEGQSQIQWYRKTGNQGELEEIIGATSQVTTL